MVRQLLCTKKQRVQIGTLKALGFKSKQNRYDNKPKRKWIIIIDCIKPVNYMKNN